MSNQHLPPGRYADNLNHLSACKAEQCGREIGNGVVFYLRQKIEQYPDSVGNKMVISVKLFGTGKEAPLGRENGPPSMDHVRQQRVDGFLLAGKESAKLCFGQPGVHGDVAQQLPGLAAIQIGA